MPRPQRSKTSFRDHRNRHKTTHFEKNPERSESKLVRNFGVSMFRTVSAHDTDKMRAQFERTAKELQLRQRWQEPRSDSKIGILRLKEVMSNADLFRKITVKDAFDALYEAVPSHRRRIANAQPVGVTILGGVNLNRRPVGILFDEDTVAQLEEERELAIGALEELCGTSEGSFNRAGSFKPNITVGHIGGQTEPGNVRKLVDGIESSLDDPVRLERATLFTGVE